MSSLFIKGYLTWLEHESCSENRSRHKLLKKMKIVCKVWNNATSSLHTYHSARSLRLSNANLFSVQFVRTSFVARSFSVAAPKIRNSPSISPYVYQSWYLPSSPQDPLLPAGLPIHLTPLLLHLRFGFCWPLCAFINYIWLIYLLTYNTVAVCIHRVKWRHIIYGHDTIAILWV